LVYLNIFVITFYSLFEYFTLFCLIYFFYIPFIIWTHKAGLLRTTDS
jgi:hypothetical protein